MARDGASCLREARSDDFVGAHQLLVALRAVGLHLIFIVGTGQRTVVDVGVFRGRAVGLVGEQCPLAGAYGAAQHAVVDVVLRIGTRHLPLHHDGLLLRSRRSAHLADVAAGRQVAGDNVRVEILAGIRGLHTVVHHVAHAAAGIEAGRGGVLVHIEAVVQRAPLVLARRAALYGPALAIGLHAVFPHQAHGILTAAVLRQLDGHVEPGVRSGLLPQVW